MARKIDFENLSNDDLLYMSSRQWLIRESEFQGIEGVRDRVKRAVAGEAPEETEEQGEEIGEEVPDYEAWTVDDLRKELKERELDDKGKKPELIARLEEDDAADEEEEEEEE